MRASCKLELECELSPNILQPASLSPRNVHTMLPLVGCLPDSCSVLFCFVIFKDISATENATELTSACQAI